MKRLALVSLAAIAYAGTAHGRAVDITGRSESFAAALRQDPVYMVPLYTGRSIYIANPPLQYRYLGPRRGLRMIDR